MKKLIAMIGAVAMSFGLFADGPTPFATSFESRDAGISTTEAGATIFTPGEGWENTTDEATFPVKAYEAGETLPYVSGTSMARRDGSFACEGDNDQYLKLSTGTNALLRTVGEGNKFLDQLVKFTGYEEPQTNLVDGVKIAVWMSEYVVDEVDNVEVTETNLYVTCAKVGGGKTEQVALKIAPPEGTEYKLDQWYRLTIKTLDSIYDPAKRESEADRAGFIIYIDGQQVAAESEDAASLIQYASEMTDVARNFMAEKKLFPAISTTDVAFNKAGFSGMGGVDDIIIDNEGPIFAQTIEIAETAFGLDPEKVEVDSVTVGGQTIEKTDGKYIVKPGDTVVVNFKALDGYFINPESKTFENVSKTTDFDVSEEIEVTEAAVMATINDTDVRYYLDLNDAYAELSEEIGHDDSVVIEILSQTALIDENENIVYELNQGAQVTIVPAGDDYPAGAYLVSIADYEEGEEDEVETVPGTATDNLGAMPGKTMIVEFTGEDELEGRAFNLQGNIYGYGEDETLIEVAGNTVLAGALTIGAACDGASTGDCGATLKTDAIDLDGYTITLVGKGKVITLDGTLDYDDFGLDAADKLSKVEGEDGYWTYTLAGGVAVTFAAIDNASVTKVMQNGVEVPGNAGTYTVNPVADLTVTITADEGYTFADGKTTEEIVTAPIAAGPITLKTEAPFAPKVQQGGMFFITLQDAIDADGDDDIVLLDNVTIDSWIAIDKEVTLDLAGFAVNSAAEWKTGDAMFAVKHGGDFTVKDTSTAGTGVIDAVPGQVMVVVKMTQDGKDIDDTKVATFTLTSGKLNGYEYGISGNGNAHRGNTSVTINGGTILVASAHDAATDKESCGIYNPQQGSLTIAGGTIEADVGVYVKSGTATVTTTGGTITGRGEAGSYEVDNDGVVYTGAAFVIDNANYVGGAPSATIAGGTFISQNGAAVEAFAREGKEKAAGFVSGGSFAGAVVPDRAVIATSEGYGPKWDVDPETGALKPAQAPYVAQNGTKKYIAEDLPAAFTEAVDGDKIQLIADANIGEFAEYGLLVKGEITKYGVLVAMKSITLDLAGYDLTGQLAGTAGALIRVAYSGELTITNSTTEVGEISVTMKSGVSPTGETATLSNSGTVNMEGGRIYSGVVNAWYGYAVANDTTQSYGGDVAIFNFRGGEIDMENGDQAVRIENYWTVAAGGLDHPNVFNMTGGTIVRGGLWVEHSNASDSCCQVNISGGTINGKLDFCGSDNTVVNISGGTFNASSIRLRDGSGEASGHVSIHTKPYIFVTGGEWKIAAYDNEHNPEYQSMLITGGTFEKVAATDEKTKSFVPAYCTIDDDTPEAGFFQVSLTEVPLTVAAGTGVSAFAYTVNGDEPVANQTVVFGDVITIGTVTYADGYKAGEVKEGTEIKVTEANIVTDKAVNITVDATKYPVKKGLLFFLTLQEAIDAEGTDDIVLCDNIKADGVTVAAAATIDMAGYTLTVSEGATLTLGDAVTLKNSVAGQGGFLNAGTIAINADQDFSNLAWGAGGFINAGAGTSAKLAIAADATVKMPTATVDLDPNQMATVTPGFWTGTATGAKVFAAANMWKYNGETWDAAVATVAGEYYFTVADALAAVQVAEAAEDFPIEVVALADGLVIQGPDGQSITLAKDGAITIKADSWAFAPAPVITKVVLVEGKKLVFPTAIENYKTVILCADGYQVVETAVDGGFEYTVALDQAFGGGSGTELDPYIIETYDHLVELQQWVADGKTTAGVYFEQMADIDFADIDDKGTAAPAWAGIGTRQSKVNAFAGVYDGGNFKIENITFVKKTYLGVFNAIENATIKNVKFGNLFESTDPEDTGDECGAALVGYVYGVNTFENCSTFGTANLSHTVAGFVVNGNDQAEGSSIKFIDCTNGMTITTSGSKAGGFIGIANGTWDNVFTRCVNTAAITATKAGGGVGGFIGYLTQYGTNTFTACSNTGVLSAGDASVGEIVGLKNGSGTSKMAFLLVDNGDNSFDVTKKLVGTYVASSMTVKGANVSYDDFHYVLNGEFVKQADLAKNTEYGLAYDVEDSYEYPTYKHNENVVFTLAEAGDWIAFKPTNGSTFAGIIDAGEGLFVELDETYADGYKYVAKAYPTFSVDKTAVGDTADVTVKVNDEDVTENIPATLEVDDTYVVTSVAATDYTYEGVTLDTGWTLSEDKTTITFSGTAAAGDEISITVPAAVEASSEPIPPLPDDETEAQKKIAEVIGGAVDATELAKLVTDRASYNAFRAWAQKTGTDPIAAEAAVLLSPNAAVSFQLSPIVATATLFENEPAVKFTAIAQSGTDWNATLQIKDGATGEEVKLAVEEAAAEYQKFVKVGTVVTDITDTATIKTTTADGNKVILTVTPPEGDAGFIKFTTAK